MENEKKESQRIKEVDDITEEVDGIPNIAQDKKWETILDNDDFTYEECIEYGDKKLEKEFEEEHG